MTTKTQEALDAIGTFRECLNDPHDFDQTMARLRAAVAEQAAEVAMHSDAASRAVRRGDALGSRAKVAERKVVEQAAEVEHLTSALAAVAGLADEWERGSASASSGGDLKVHFSTITADAAEQLRRVLAPASTMEGRVTR